MGTLQLKSANALTTPSGGSCSGIIDYAPTYSYQIGIPRGSTGSAPVDTEKLNGLVATSDEIRKGALAKTKAVNRLRSVSDAFKETAAKRHQDEAETAIKVLYKISKMDQLYPNDPGISSLRAALYNQRNLRLI